ncbi:hypothetical protein TSUD_192150 [Trifolium subterraneum]|uniref:Uncharacterized protein n=1 Tax=Trifolium subterraneum TaxID=3900 RepID=A0A2Z6P0Z7_TRISU|nr:hypothetical protein TSUD_192150 [Trifolium subterraneum]
MSREKDRKRDGVSWMERERWRETIDGERPMEREVDEESWMEKDGERRLMGRDGWREMERSRWNETNGDK